MLSWSTCDIVVTDQSTKQIQFEQKQVEAPETWSLGARSVVARDYFAGALGAENREHSVKQLIDRVVDAIVRQGVQEGYLEVGIDADSFREELTYMLATQRISFSDEVWRTIGVADRTPQAAAYCILAVENTVESILQWYAISEAISSYGGDSGVNVSSIQNSSESADGVGVSTGPLNFIRGSSADSDDQGGPRLVIMDIDHPDIEKFVAGKLSTAGVKRAIRVSDEFMYAVEDNLDWSLKAAATRKTLRTVKARDLWNRIVEATRMGVNIGLQFDTTINKWHTLPAAGRVSGSSVHGEYMGLDNSACGLASINLLKYLNEDLSFNIEAFKHTIELTLTAQEILISISSYPSQLISKNTKAYRQLGISCVNLGAMLETQELAYDSDDAKSQAAAVVALMTGHAYAISAKIAQKMGPFAGFHKNSQAMRTIMKMHRDAVNGVDASMVAEDLLSAATQAWDEAGELVELYGARNAQVSLLNSADSVGHTMDPETVGIDPAAMNSGGVGIGQWRPRLEMMAAVQPFISGAVGAEVYVPADATAEVIERIYVDSWKAGLKAVNVSFGALAAVEEDIVLKMDTESSQAEAVIAIVGSISNVASDQAVLKKDVVRHYLPKVRTSQTYKFQIADLDGYFTVGEYEDRTPGELFIHVSRQGDTVVGLMDAFAISVSKGLQYGVPLTSYIGALQGMKFAPSGMTDDADISTASSVIDYIMHRLAMDYLSFEDRVGLGLTLRADMTDAQTSLLEAGPVERVIAAAKEPDVASPATSIDGALDSLLGVEDSSTPLCYNCSKQTQRVGSCYVCNFCGSTTSYE